LKPFSTNDFLLVVNQTTFYFLLAKKYLNIKPSFCKVFYTHFQTGADSLTGNLQQLANCKEIFVPNKSAILWLRHQGISAKKLTLVHGGIDKKIFYPQQEIDSYLKHRILDYILIVGDCKFRKNPWLVVEVISKMPQQNFIIHGRGWKEFILSELEIFPINLDVLDFNFDNQPRLIREASVFLTLSSLEGGPYPTLEALASGTPVVATPTGWNPEFITKKNGVLLPDNPLVPEVVNGILIAKKMKFKVYKYNLLNDKLSLEEFGHRIYRE
jgi:glycosyltransferase involved in cell wall biosynthesis